MTISGFLLGEGPLFSRAHRKRPRSNIAGRPAAHEPAVGAAGADGSADAAESGGSGGSTGSGTGTGAGSKEPKKPQSVASKLNWLRAGVLGANDGIVSISGLLIGVAAADPSNTSAILIAGIAGIVSAALSMAVGEYVSVSTQRDTEEELVVQKQKLIDTDPAGQEAQLAHLWEGRGLTPNTAKVVAAELTERDAVGSHMRIEHNIDPGDLTNPWAAAGSSMVSFVAGSAIPFLAMILCPPGVRIAATFGAVLVALALTGYISAWLGDAPKGRAVARLLLGGTVAMALTYVIGHTFGVNA